MFALLDCWVNTLSYIPRLVKSKAHQHLAAWFPNLISPLCHQSDFLCRETNGLLKLEDLFPKAIIDGLDWCNENPYLVTGVAGAAIVGGGIFYFYRRCHSQQASLSPKPTTSPRVSLGH